MTLADVVVTRADRIAAVSALGMTMPDAWLATGEVRRGPWGNADTLTQEECVVNDVAHAIAAARAAERERCAGMVREMEKKLGLLAEHAHIARKDRDAVCPTPDYLEGSADTYEKAEQLASDLAERIGKGE